MSINSDFFQSSMNQKKNITKIRDYIIIKRIGFGSSGLVYQVYKSNDPSKSILILKQIPFRNVSNDLEETTRKLKEAKNESLILSKLSFKYVVKYYDSFIEDDCLNIIMEYCEEGDLGSLINNLIQNKSSLSEQQIWHFFIQISLGLAYIHNNKILHRDLKPMNIFLKKNNLIKIGDLGVAKMLQTNTKALTYIGTPYYLSPEVCEGKPYNSKSDVWALGCILYELCTFKKPFNAFNQAALCMKIIQGKYTPMSKLENVQRYSKNLENIINIMLKRDYMERPLMKEILNNKIFFEKAIILGYDEDIKSIYNHYNLKIKNNIHIKYIDSNKKYCIDNTNEQYNIRENKYEKKKTIPSQSRENKMKRVYSSGIYKNKSRISIQNSINNISKISKKSNSKKSCKKYKTKYKIFPSHDKKKCNSIGKNTIETSHNYNRIHGRNKEKNANILTTINNYQENKKKFIIPRQSSKKIMMKNNIINNSNDDRPILIKCNSNINNNISLINNKMVNENYKEKKETSFNMRNLEEKKIIKYIHISKGESSNNYNFKKEFNFIKRNLLSDMKELYKSNDNNMSNNNVSVNKKDLLCGKNLDKPNTINKSGIKIIGIDKKYVSINKSSVNCKNKIKKKIILNQNNSKPKKIERENKMISRKMTNDYKSSDNLLKKQKNNIEIENNINNSNFNGTQIKLHKNIINGNVINKYTSPYKLKEFKENNNNKDINYINTDDNQINKNMNNNYFELNNFNTNNYKRYNEKPKLEEIFTITINNTSDKTDNQYLNEEFYKSYFDNSNNEINITKTEEDDDKEEKVSVLKEKNNYMKEKISQRKKEYLLKYNEYKNNILKYKSIIDIEKLFSLYEMISKDKDRSENITKEIEYYLKANLPKEFYKKFQKLFNNFIFYDIEIGNINRLQQKFS